MNWSAQQQQQQKNLFIYLVENTVNITQNIVNTEVQNPLYISGLKTFPHVFRFEILLYTDIHADTLTVLYIGHSTKMGMSLNSFCLHDIKHIYIYIFVLTHLHRTVIKFKLKIV